MPSFMSSSLFFGHIPFRSCFFLSKAGPLLRVLFSSFFLLFFPLDKYRTLQVGYLIGNSGFWDSLFSLDPIVILEGGTASVYR